MRSSGPGRAPGTAGSNAEHPGILHLAIDGILLATLSPLPTGAVAVDSVRLGALGVKPGASGSLHFDAYEGRRITLAGPGP